MARMWPVGKFLGKGAEVLSNWQGEGIGREPCVHIPLRAQ